jgi:hypothetical protein
LSRHVGGSAEAKGATEMPAWPDREMNGETLLELLRELPLGDHEIRVYESEMVTPATEGATHFRIGERMFVLVRAPF